MTDRPNFREIVSEQQLHGLGKTLIKLYQYRPQAKKHVDDLLAKSEKKMVDAYMKEREKLFNEAEEWLEDEAS